MFSLWFRKTSQIGSQPTAVVYRLRLGISFPISTNDIVKFVKQNNHLNLNIKINILMASGKDIFPLKCAIGEGQITINLLMAHSETWQRTISHFLLTRNLDRFLLKTYKEHFCYLNCFNKFSIKLSRDIHVDHCIYHKARIEKSTQPDK